MSFNDNADLDTSQVEGGGGGGGMFSGGGMPGGGIVVGGGAGGILLLIIYLVSAASAASGGGSGSPQGQLDQGQVQAGGSQAGDFSQCKTGADANRDAQCRVIGTVNSVQAYWAAALPRYGTTYSPSNTVLYSGSTQSRCGTASNQVGPFYCPLDRKVYIDASFFDELTTRFGADGGALAQEYVVAHEYGHHIQDLLGVLDAGAVRPAGRRERRGPGRADGRLPGRRLGQARHRDQGRPGRRVPQAADPAGHRSPRCPRPRPSATTGSSSRPRAGSTPRPWTHGSSAQRQTWFTTGYRSGDLDACDTLHARDALTADHPQTQPGARRHAPEGLFWRTRRLRVDVLVPLLPAPPHQRRAADTTLSPATASARFAHACSWQERCTQAVRDGVAVPWGEARSRHRGPLPGRGAARAGEQVPEPDRSCLASGPWSLPHERVTSRCPHAPVPPRPPRRPRDGGRRPDRPLLRHRPLRARRRVCQHRQPGRRGRRHPQGRAVRLRRRGPHPLRLLRPDQVGLRPRRQDAPAHRPAAVRRHGARLRRRLAAWATWSSSRPATTAPSTTSASTPVPAGSGTPPSRVTT